MDKPDERIYRLVASTFTDVYHGKPISESEFEYEQKLRAVYKQELDQPKEIIATDLDFQNLSYQKNRLCG